MATRPAIRHRRVKLCAAMSAALCTGGIRHVLWSAGSIADLDTRERALHGRSVPEPTPQIDLDGYFARTGYTGPRTATIETLHAIAHAHVCAIPFENLDVLLGRPVDGRGMAPAGSAAEWRCGVIDLDLAAVERKLVTARRGGYCFEQNSLMLAVLTQLGFDAYPVAGRFRFGRPRDYAPPRTHLFLRVELDGPWLVDVGAGGMSLTSAIRLDTDAPQPTPHEPRRLDREAGVVYHQAQLDGEWQDVWSSTLEAMPPIDREVGNWYTSSHPASSFKAALTIARALPDGGRLGLRNRELTTRRRDGSADRHIIATPDELLEVLASKFGVLFPAGTRFTCPGLEW